MPTETPPTPPTTEINMSSLGKSGKRGAVPPETVAAINAAANQRGGKPSEAIAPAEPPPDPTPPTKTPPEPNGEPAKAPHAPPAPPAPPTPPREPAEPESKGIKSLRENFERKSAEYEELKVSMTATAKEKADADLRRAESEVKLQAAIEREEKEYKPRMERLKKVEEDLARKEEVLRIKDYTATEEFHNTYVKPLADAQAEVNELLGELTVATDDGTSRLATMDDFNEVLAARSLNDAHAIAQRKFGPIAPTVVNFRTRIRGLERQRTEAVKNAGIKSAEFVQQQQAQMAQTREQIRNTLLTEAQRLIGETPELNVPEDDQDGRATMQSATAFADRLLNGDPSWTPEQWAKEVAKGRVKMIGHDVMKSKLTKAQSRIAELETQLKAYESSEPDIKAGGGRPAAAPVNGEKPEKNALLAAANALAAKRGS